MTDFFCNLQVYRVDRSNKIPRSIPRVSSSGKRGILLNLILEQRVVPSCVLVVGLKRAEINRKVSIVKEMQVDRL